MLLIVGLMINSYSIVIYVEQEKILNTKDKKY